jgi:hypothetical protein
MKKLQIFLEEAQGIKPLNYDSVLKEKNEFRKQHNLLEVKLNALTMEEKDANLWWDAVHNIVYKDIGKVCRLYGRNERIYIHRIFQMDKVIPSFQYEPLVLTPKPKTLDEEEKRGNIDGAGPSKIKIEEEEPTNIKEGKNSS